MRGVTLEEIAEATKIGGRALRALETEKFDQLPGGIFNKGFVRSYSKYLGIDEEQAVSDYLAAEVEAQPPGPIISLAPSAQAKPWTRTFSEDAEPIPRGLDTALWLVGAALIVVFALIFGGWKLHSRFKAGDDKAMAAAKETKVVGANSAPATVSATRSATPEPAGAASNSAQPADAASFELLIRARQESWVKITADGKLVMEGLLNASSEKSVYAKRRVVFSTGNAGGVDVSYNGQALPQIGRAGQIRTLTFTPQGLRRE